MKKLLLLIVLGLGLLPGMAFADITWNPVMEGYDMTEDEYFAEAAEGQSGTFSFTGGKFVNPQNAYFLVAGIYTTSLPFASTFSVDVTFSDGFTTNIMFNSSKYAQIPSSYFADHPSKGITLKLNSDGKKAHKVYMNGYGLKDYDGPGPTAAPTTKPTPAPTVKPTPAPTVKPTTTPGKTTSPNPTAGATAGATTQPTTPPGSGDPDPGGGEPECTAACQAMIDQLDCPQWDDYMGAWSDMIKGTYPPPPDWDNVAAIMRDKIVPAMGQELVNRSPEIARIIADEFQSREKAVSPPSAVPDFTQPVPRLQDVPKVTGSINDNVPSFAPDYSEDKPFVIPDPSTLDFTDNSDDGYEYQPMVTESPEYVSGGPEPSATDKGYEVKAQPTFLPPKYVGGSWRDDQPPPDYQTDEGQTETIPEYQQRGEDTGSYQAYRDIPDVFQEYKGGE